MDGRRPASAGAQNPAYRPARPPLTPLICGVTVVNVGDEFWCDNDCMPSTGALYRFPDNLPRQLTSFIGRERELQDLKGLLQRSRLLTLTGPGGSGKTRLGLRLAVEVTGGFPDGVYFVPLAPVGNPDLVLSSIAQGIGLRDVGDRPLLDRLRSHTARTAGAFAALAGGGCP